MKIKTEQKRGRTRWVIQSFEKGKRKRRYFDSETDAIQAARGVEREIARCSRWWVGLTDGEQMEIAAVVEEMRQAGAGLRALWDASKCGGVKVEAVTLGLKKRSTK